MVKNIPLINIKSCKEESYPYHKTLTYDSNPWHLTVHSSLTCYLLAVTGGMNGPVKGVESGLVTVGSFPGCCGWTGL